jgi:hypothetical protein
MAIKVLAERLFIGFKSVQLNELICRPIPGDIQLAIQSIAYDSFASLKTFDMSKYSFNEFFVNKTLQLLVSTECFFEDNAVKNFIEGILTSAKDFFDIRDNFDIENGTTEIRFDDSKGVVLFSLHEKMLENPAFLENFIKKIDNIPTEQLEKLEDLFYQKYESLKIEDVFERCFKGVNLEPLDQMQQLNLFNFFREIILQVSEAIVDLRTSEAV